MSAAPQREQRVLQVPEELAGARADAIVAQLSGLLRTATGRLFEAQEVEVDGAPIAKSRKLAQGAAVHVLMPEEIDLSVIVPETVDGFSVIHADDDIVVIDKPAGVAAHPSCLEQPVQHGDFLLRVVGPARNQRRVPW